MRLTLDEYSQYFKMSKEMINSKLRAKKLNYIIENGVTYIIVTKHSIDEKKTAEITQEKQKLKRTPAPVAKQKTTVSMVLSLYQKENQQLKEKILQLEEKIDKLIDDKEQMLRDEMSKIEKVYSAKDEQLKTVLELINTQINAQKNLTIHEVEPETPKVEHKEEDVIVELKSYLKSLDLTQHEKKTIKRRFLEAYNKDVRIIKQNGKLYLDFSKYDYSDLLEY